MALAKTITLDSGITMENAYIRIQDIRGNKNSIDIILSYYFNEQSYFDNKSVVMQRKYTFIPSVDDGSNNFIEQGYEYLKALDNFKEAVDC